MWRIAHVPRVRHRGEARQRDTVLHVDPEPIHRQTQAIIQVQHGAEGEVLPPCRRVEVQNMSEPTESAFIDTVSWTPSDLGRRTRCRGADRRIRRSTGSRWSTWCVGGGRPIRTKGAGVRGSSCSVDHGELSAFGCGDGLTLACRRLWRHETAGRSKGGKTLSYRRGETRNHGPSGRLHLAPQLQRSLSSDRRWSCRAGGPLLGGRAHRAPGSCAIEARGS